MKYEIAAEIRKEIASGETTRRVEYRAIRKEAAANLAALVSAYEQSDTPAETVKRLVEALGLSNAAEIVAAVVIAKGNFDGRISRGSREWASSIVPATASEVEEALGVYYPDKIHPAHMEQIANETMSFAPEALDANKTIDTREAEKAEDQENAPALPNVADDAVEPKAAPDGDIFDIIRAALDAHRVRSAWGRGVKEYAAELLEELEELSLGGYFAADDISDKTKATAAMLNGAKDWRQYSWGGSALVYDEDIAKRLCNPSELKKTRGGERRPNASEEWLDVQARALGQAARLVCILAKEASR